MPALRLPHQITARSLRFTPKRHPLRRFMLYQVRPTAIPIIATTRTTVIMAVIGVARPYLSGLDMAATTGTAIMATAVIMGMGATTGMGVIMATGAAMATAAATAMAAAVIAAVDT